MCPDVRNPAFLETIPHGTVIIDLLEEGVIFGHFLDHFWGHFLDHF